MQRPFGIGLVGLWGIAACVGSDPIASSPPTTDAGGTSGTTSGTSGTTPVDSSTTEPDAGSSGGVPDAQPDAQPPPPTFCSGRSEDVCEDFDRGLPPKGWALPQPQYAATSFLEVEGANGSKAMQTHPDGQVAAQAAAGGPSIARDIDVNASDAALSVELQFQVDDLKDGGTILSLALNATDVIRLGLQTVGSPTSLGFGYSKGSQSGGIGFTIGPGWHKVKIVVQKNGNYTFAIDGNVKGIANPATFEPLGQGPKELRIGAYSPVTFATAKNLPIVRFEEVLADSK